MEFLIVLVSILIFALLLWIFAILKDLSMSFASYKNDSKVYEENDKLLEEYRAIKAIPELYEDMYKKAQELAEDGTETVAMHICRMMEIFDIEVRDKK